MLKSNKKINKLLKVNNQKMQGLTLTTQTRNKTRLMQQLIKCYIASNNINYLNQLAFIAVRRTLLIHSINSHNKAMFNYACNPSNSLLKNNFDIISFRCDFIDGIWFGMQELKFNCKDLKPIIKSGYKLLNHELYHSQSVKVMTKPFSYVLISELLENGKDITIIKGIKTIINNNTNFDNFEIVTNEKALQVQYKFFNLLFKKISDRQKNIVYYLAQNYSNRQIAQKIKIAHQNVSKHIKIIKNVADNILSEFTNEEKKYIIKF